MDEVFNDTVDMGEIGLATRAGRRADAEERNVSALQGDIGTDRRMERAGSDRFRKQGLESGLDHRAVTGADGRNLHFVRVDSPDVVTVRGQARCGDGADITKPEDGDLHALGCRGATANVSCDGFMHNMSHAAPVKYTIAAIS